MFLITLDLSRHPVCFLQVDDEVEEWFFEVSGKFVMIIKVSVC